MKRGAFIVSVLAASAAPAAAATASGREFSLGNQTIAAHWAIADGRFIATRLEDRQSGVSMVAQPDLFTVILEDERLDGSGVIRSSQMHIVAGPATRDLVANPHASRMSERLGGSEIVLDLYDPQTALHAQWRASMRHGSHYIRQDVTFTTDRPLPLSEIRLIDQHLAGARVVGAVAGSPIAARTFFFGYEDPIAQSEVGYDNRVRAYRAVSLPLLPGQSMDVSSVAGVATQGQLRRDFLRYVERERAHPYRTFLHYNSWYDIGYFTPYTADQAVERIHTFGDALSVQRAVKLDSFLFDDGWDDYSGTWRFNSGFPDGFSPLHGAAGEYGAGFGCWMSPWGGYGKPRQERIARAKALGYETDSGGLALAGPKYYALFHGVALDLINRYGVNQFKLDGTGSTGATVAGSAFNSDFDAAIHLIELCRKAEPNLFVNLTTGTYASPFWLRYADSIWRGGYDHNFAGAGSRRQRWMTYRDLDTYRNIVLGGPLFPLNSLMLHGLIYAQHAKHLNDDPQGDFDADIRTYFGNGTQLQELYITPSLLSDANWNMLAEAANWSCRNAQTLVDTHWVGGDPAELEIYGWAAWSAQHASLVLRNPSDRAQSIELDPAHVFELPPHAPQRFSARSPWSRDRARAPIALSAGRLSRFTLQPFEVLTLDATPQEA
ncbi:MAG: enterotoxin [Vulcanimicrobiaceae bacterium]